MLKHARRALHGAGTGRATGMRLCMCAQPHWMHLQVGNHHSKCTACCCMCIYDIDRDSDMHQLTLASNQLSLCDDGESTLGHQHMHASSPMGTWVTGTADSPKLQAPPATATEHEKQKSKYNWSKQWWPVFPGVTTCRMDICCMW